MTSQPKKDLRLAALRRFATAFTLFTVLGHLFLGFEPSYAHVVVSLLTGYIVDLFLETVDAWAHDRPARYRGGWIALVNFLLPAHITSLAVALLLYANEQLLPIVFATTVAMSSKFFSRIQLNDRYLHFLNPSNTGISVTLILFPWVGITPPYQYTENLYGVADWLLPLFFIVFGTFLNARYARRIPLVAAWLVAFALQAMLRSTYFGTPMMAELEMMTGVSFLLFTFYMIEDPGSTPFKPWAQVVFGASIALVYAILMVFHVVFGLFFALFIVCLLRGVYLLGISYLFQPVPLTKEVTP